METWRARIAAGEVDVDDRRADALKVVRAGEVVAWRRPPWEEPAVPLAWAVLFRDDHLLAVAKPRGLPTMPAGGFLEHTLLRLVQRRYREATNAHRLGRGTSGLVLFARSDPARRALARAWREGGVVKRYRALVRGTPLRDAFDVAVPIGEVAHPRLGRVWAAADEGRAALTRVRVLSRAADRAIVEAVIPTGRPHQIRIHLAAAGHPLLGDPLYGVGGVPIEQPGLPGDGGYVLHAHQLELAHPVTGAVLLLECAPPPVLRVGRA